MFQSIDKRIKYIYLLLTFFAIIVYHQAFYAIFAFGDSPHLMINSEDLIPHCVKEGRLLQAYFFKFMFASNSIKALIFFRVFSLLTWIFNLGSFMFIYQKVNTKIKLNHILFLTCSSLLLMFNLSTSLFIGWTSCAQVGLGFGAGLWSGYLFVHAQDLKGSKRNKSLLLSLLLIVVAFMFYQTMSLAFLLPIYFAFSTRDKKPWDILKEGLVAYGIGLALYMFVFKLSLRLYGFTATTRGELTSDIIGKIKFFVSEALFKAAKPIYFIEEYKTLPLLILGIIIMSFVLIPFIKKVCINSILLNLLCIIIFIVFSYYPNLIINESWAASRSLSILSLMIGLIFFDALYIRFKSFLVLKFIITITLLVIIPLRAYKNFNSYFVNPLKHEYKMVYNALDENNSSMMLIRSNWDSYKKRFGVRAHYDEYAIPATFISWTIQPLVENIMMQKFKSFDRKKADIVVKDYKYIPSKEEKLKYKILDFHSIIE